MWQDVSYSLNLRIKLEQKGEKGEKGPIFLVLSERERRKRGGESKLLSTIYGVPSVGIRRAKNESSSH